MSDRIYIKQPDWVLPRNQKIDSKKINLEQLDRVVKKGFIVEHDPDKNETKVTGQVVIKGNTKGSLDISK
jgi:hypothetical protein